MNTKKEFRIPAHSKLYPKVINDEVLAVVDIDTTNDSKSDMTIVIPTNRLLESFASIKLLHPNQDIVFAGKNLYQNDKNKLYYLNAGSFHFEPE